MTENDANCPPADNTINTPRRPPGVEFIITCQIATWSTRLTLLWNRGWWYTYHKHVCLYLESRALPTMFPVFPENHTIISLWYKPFQKCVNPTRFHILSQCYLMNIFPMWFIVNYESVFFAFYSVKCKENSPNVNITLYGENVIHLPR